jgi:hypothetical protein
MDNSLYDDISSMVATNNAFFFKNFIDTSPDKDTGDDTDILVAAVILYHEHNEPARTWRGSHSWLSG